MFLRNLLCVFLVGAGVGLSSEAYAFNPFRLLKGARVTRGAKATKTTRTVLRAHGTQRLVVRRGSKGSVSTTSAQAKADARPHVTTYGLPATKKPYGDIVSRSKVGRGREFAHGQKQRIRQRNLQLNGHRMRDDATGAPLRKAQQHTKGVTPPKNEAHVDHIVPRSKGGANSYGNASVRSRADNLSKGARAPGTLDSNSSGGRR